MIIYKNIDNYQNTVRFLNIETDRFAQTMQIQIKAIRNFICIFSRRIIALICLYAPLPDIANFITNYGLH